MFFVSKRCVSACIFLFFFTFLYSQTVIPHRPKVGLVLSGGGAKGLAHIGVLKVLEEAKIPIDYIGGTSMGSIIGGLYAIGYSSHQLDSMVRTIQWDELLMDKVPRRSLSMMEKDEDLRYLFSFPIRMNKISMPAAIVAGQNISMFFSRLTSPVFGQTDFSKFRIPFLCVATDIEHGKQYVIRHGNLATAMRASMAIPTVFTPEEFEGLSLLDGGLINNFPVQEVKAMGADIIIGVDVGFKFLSHNELNSIMRIIEQSIFMHSMEDIRINRDSCQIYIHPDMNGYNMSSFGKTDSLIVRGERAARQQFSDLAQLGKYLRSFNDSSTHMSVGVQPVSKIKVNKLRIDGLKNVPQNFIRRKIPFDIPGEVSPQEIESFIESIYGTAFFERVTYRFEPFNDGVLLVLDATERSTNFFRVGLHYDSDFNTSLLLNTTYRNFLLRGAKISIDVSLGDNLMFSALLYKNTGWKLNNEFISRRKLVPDFGLQLKAHTMDYFMYQNNQKISSYKFNNFSTDIFLQANPVNNISFKLGALVDLSRLTNQIGVLSQSPVDQSFFGAYFNYRRDACNYAFYPSKGGYEKLEVRLMNDFGFSKENAIPFFLQAYYSGSYVIPLSRRIALIPGITAGGSLGDSIPSHYRYYMGGQVVCPLRGYTPFTGLAFMQLSGKHEASAKLDIQCEIWNDNFLIMKTCVGKTSEVRKNLLLPEDWALGYGVAFGYRSPIGPMEISLMSSNKVHRPMVFVNIGYPF
jgi:NTE family protein